MLSSEEQTKELPIAAPSLKKGLAPSHEYAQEVFRRFHHHSLSDTTTGSNESSPTTTISTVDDSSATEPSPGSSPESPPPANFAGGRPRTSDDNRPFFELQKQPPPRKGRNLKNLAVNTNRHPGRAASTTSLPLPAPSNMDSSPIISPSFVKPPTPPKRKPSNLGLTLLTPGTSKAPPQLAIPPTPAFGRPATLRHFQSSPSLPLFPSLSTQNRTMPQVPRVQTTLETILSPTETAPRVLVEEDEEEQNFDVPLSKEEKPEAYPDGPICVYDPHIDLYLEPTAEQCRQYDVIMNVASEVRNPLAEQDGAVEEPDLRIDGGGGIQYAPKRGPSSEQGVDPERPRDSSPTTPKATPLTESSPGYDTTTPKREPEYLHIKWEHNSDIVPDLLRLVKLIDEKVLHGKRVLIHCQCGVSRSASLVVAYGLYKDPSLSVQEAYDAVKRKSKWIGPNMNLIMQLQEFRTSLSHGGLLAANRGLSPITPSSAMREWRGPFASDLSERTVPLSAGVLPLTKAQTAEALPVLTGGPSSAPSDLAWPAQAQPGQRARAISAVKLGSAYVNTSGKVVPVVPAVQVIEPNVASATPPANSTSQPVTTHKETSAEGTTSSPTEEFAMTPLKPSAEADPADSFGLMSPSSTEFASSPFDRPMLLAQLGMGTVRQQDDVPPRRSVSLRSKSKLQPGNHSAAVDGSGRGRLVRGKISSPNIREQQQLHSLQAEIEASLPHRNGPGLTLTGIDEALMSPRATEFTENPFALSLSVPESSPPEEAPRSTDSDPRSPPQKGVSPITRNILDVL